MKIEKFTGCDSTDLLRRVNRQSQSPRPGIRITLAPGAVLPERKTAGAVGYDLCALYAVDIPPCHTARIKTGVSLAVPDGWEAQVRPRSSLSSNGLIGHVGTIDPDYRGDVGVILTNFGQRRVTIKAGDRIAQLVFARVERPVLEVVDRLDETERGAGGFGSTGR